MVPSGCSCHRSPLRHCGRRRPAAPAPPPSRCSAPRPPRPRGSPARPPPGSLGRSPPAPNPPRSNGRHPGRRAAPAPAGRIWCGRPRSSPPGRTTSSAARSRPGAGSSCRSPPARSRPRQDGRPHPDRLHRGDRQRPQRDPRPRVDVSADQDQVCLLARGQATARSAGCWSRPAPGGRSGPGRPRASSSRRRAAPCPRPRARSAAAWPIARFSAAAVPVRSSNGGIDRTSPAYTAPPCVRFTDPARSSTSRSRRIVLSETPRTRTSSSRVAITLSADQFHQPSPSRLWQHARS